MTDKTLAPRPVRKALVVLVASVGTNVTTLMLTAASAAAAERIAVNHNENAAADQG